MVEPTPWDLQRILVPTDFSRSADGALKHALFLAELFDAELHILHAAVLHTSAADVDEFPSGEEIFALLHEIAESKLNVLLQKAEQRAIRIREAQRRGFTEHETILGYAKEVDADLILMGTHGRRGVSRLLLGSVTEAVMRHSHLPVMTVRNTREAADSVPVRRVLAPIDFSDSTEASLQRVLGLADRLEASLDLLHVIEIPTPPAFYPVVPVNYASTELLGSVTEKVEALQREISTTHEVRGHVRTGHAASEILATATELKSDLITMASHGRRGVDRLVLGSTAEGVLRRADCPVLVFKGPTEKGDD